MRTPKNVRPDLTAAVSTRGVNATSLPDDIEDQLRLLIITTATLAPLEILAAFHLARKWPTGKLSKTIRAFAEAGRSYKENDRVRTMYHWRAFIRQCPAIKAIQQWQDRRPRHDKEATGKPHDDAADTLAPFRRFVAELLTLSEIDAATVLLFMKGYGLKEATAAIDRLCVTGREADQMADRLADIHAARRFARVIVAKFAPFADTLSATLPAEKAWVKISTTKREGARPYALKSVADARQARAIEEQKRAEREKQRRERFAKLSAQYVMSYAEAAKAIGISRLVVRAYARNGNLAPVYREDRKRAEGVTRASVKAYLAHLDEIKRRHEEVKARKERQHLEHLERVTTGIYYTERGERITNAERINSDEAADMLGVSRKSRTHITAMGFERVYIDAARRHAVGYLRASVEAIVAARIEKRANAVFYTATGKITAAQRISRNEAAAELHVKELTVTAYARAGEIARVYADPDLLLPCGFTRESVALFAQAHPRHIPAKRAVAVANFQIEVLPPKPHAPVLRAAKLDPAADAKAEATDAEPTRSRARIRATIVFTLTTEQLTTTDTRTGEDTMDAPEATPTEAADNATPAKLQIAKAFTVHESGVIRAICVSESDRDEIVAALELYRKAKANPGEIESALAFYRNARTFLGIGLEEQQPPATQTASHAANAE